MPTATWYARNKEKAKEQFKNWSADNLEYNRQRKRDWYKNVGRKRDLLLKYGLTLEQYNTILKAQGGVCALCPVADRLCVDHNHSTNKVRGLLCYDCNRNFIGSHTDPAKFYAAAEYLEHSWQDGRREKMN